MRRAVTLLVALAAGSWTPVAVAGISASPQVETAVALRAARPVAGTSPTIADGEDTVAAWLQDGERRVFATTAGADAARMLGPDGDGSDGAPVSAASGDGSVWVMASRSARGAQRLWLQRRSGGAWLPAIPGPVARRYDHHPALVAVGGTNELWAAWIGEDDPRAAALYASRWTGAEWTPPEVLPRVVGPPMAPAIAIDDAGAPVVVWAAGDGNDAEIRVSTRRGGRWTAPVTLTRNNVPDIAPSIATTRDGLAAAWITYADDGYLPVASVAADARSWQAPRLVSSVAGNHPRVVSAAGTTAILWRRLDEDGGGTIVGRPIDGDASLEPVAVASASGSPFAVSATSGGRLSLAFARTSRDFAIVAGDRGGPEGLDALARAAAARFGAPVERVASATPVPALDHLVPLVPLSYTAFGDSITNGVVYDPDRRTSEGYRAPLQQMLRAFFRLGTVFNAGVDGEPTADGVGRIDNAISAQQPEVILIMEGTNDIIAAIDVDTIVFNLRRMVQRSYEEKSDIKPFLAQLPPRLDPGEEGFDGPGNGRIDEINSRLPEIGEEEGAVIVDMNTPIDGHPELMSNPVHPSIAGYEVMAVQWYDAIKPKVLDDTNRGDLDGSGRTDGLDLVHLSLAFGSIDGEERYDAQADINGDGIVDGFDLGILIDLFGQSTSPEEEEEGS
jgi:lysophospholipase L1-like esterase